MCDDDYDSSIDKMIRPSLTEQQVIDLILQRYGLNVTSCEQLEGYDDKNFRIKVDENFSNRFIDKLHPKGYVFKVLNSIDSAKTKLIEGQNALMFHLATRGFRVPQPVRNKSGRYYSREKFTEDQEENAPFHVVRLLLYQEGTKLSDMKPSHQIYIHVGILTAQVDRSLQSFYHEAYDSHDSIWMLKNAVQVRPHIHAVDSPKKRELVEKTIAEFENNVLPDVPQLRSGMIHGDINEHNILMDGDAVAALLDFGDSHQSLYLFEVAIALCYVLIHGQDIHYGKSFLEGYQQIRLLPSLEVKHLKLCVCARLCQSLVLGAYSAMNDPTNEYILSSQKVGWKILEELSGLSNDEISKLWLINNENDSNFKLSP